MNEKKFTTKTIIMAIVLSMAASVGGTLWGSIALINTTPFRVSALEKQVEEVKKVVDDNNAKFMPLDLSQERWKNNDYQHNEIIRRLDVIQTTLAKLR